jgi:hypothetical protein
MPNGFSEILTDFTPILMLKNEKMSLGNVLYCRNLDSQEWFSSIMTS